MKMGGGIKKSHNRNRVKRKKIQQSLDLITLRSGTRIKRQSWLPNIPMRDARDISSDIEKVDSSQEFDYDGQLSQRIKSKLQALHNGEDSPLIIQGSEDKPIPSIFKNWPDAPLSNGASHKSESVVNLFSSLKRRGKGNARVVEFNNREEKIEEVEESTLSDYSMINDEIIYYISSDFCIILVKDSKPLYLYGKVRASCLYGHIEVLGYRLNDDFQDVYSPRKSSALCFKTQPSDACNGLFRQLRKLGVPVGNAEELAIKTRPNDAILMLKPLENALTSFIQTNFKIFDPFSRKGLPSEIGYYDVEQHLKCNLFSEAPKQSIAYNPQWAEISSQICSKTLIVGGKNAGKSTFLRYCVNRALSQCKAVAVIDLDPGQSEFTIPTSVSVSLVDKPLTGTNFTHLRNPLKMYNIGTINVMENLEQYLTAIKTLFGHCRTDPHIHRLPWFINTMGMTDETGLQIITFIIALANPDALIQLESKNDFSVALQPGIVRHLTSELNLSNFDNNMRIHEYEYHSLRRDEAPQEVNNFPKHQRFLNILAYFSQLLNDKRDDLFSVKPLSAPLEKIKIATSGLCENNIMSVINGKTVALCTEITNTAGETCAECFGYGIIRGIDPNLNRVYITTPVKNMSAVNMLVLLETLPDLCLLNEARAVADGNLPYCSHLSKSMKQHRLLKTPQRRFNLLQLLKIKGTTR